MIKYTYRCDRCNQEMTENYYRVFFQDQTPVQPGQIYYSSDGVRYIGPSHGTDLCSKCSDGLRDIIKGYMDVDKSN